MSYLCEETLISGQKDKTRNNQGLWGETESLVVHFNMRKTKLGITHVYEERLHESLVVHFKMRKTKLGITHVYEEKLKA